MRRATAAKIAVQLKQFGRAALGYRITRIREGRPLRSFHQWVDGKSLVSADRVDRGDGRHLIPLLIDWAETGEFLIASSFRRTDLAPWPRFGRSARGMARRPRLDVQTGKARRP
jgi:hypothetical protein